MENLGFYNGQYDLIENLKIPFDDRVHFYGDGVYDATCAGNHVIFNLEEHLDRFYKSAALLEILIPYEKEEFKILLQEMVDKVEGDELFVYWQVTRGTAPRKHAFPAVKANIWMMIRPSAIGNPEKKLSLVTVEDTRFLHCNIKTLNLIPNVMAAQKAEEAGCQEAVFHRGERVTECAHSNISILKDGVFQTAPTDNLILPGIARSHILKMCKVLSIPTKETPFTTVELFDADEVIVCSSSNFCMSVEKIDGVPVGGKAPELLAQLQKALMDEYMEAIGKGH